MAVAAIRACLLRSLLRGGNHPKAEIESTGWFFVSCGRAGRGALYWTGPAMSPRIRPQNLPFLPPHYVARPFVYWFMSGQSTTATPPFSLLCCPPSAYRSMPTHFRPNSDRYTPFSPLLCSPPSDYWSMSCQSTTVTPPSHYCVPRPPHCLSVLVNFMSGQTATIDGPVDRPRSGHGERSSRD